MKKFTTIQLLLGCALILAFYSCTPRYGAHFTKTDNFYQAEKPLASGEKSEVVTKKDIERTEPSQGFEAVDTEPDMDQYVASQEKAIPVTPDPSIEKLVEKHKQRIDEIKASDLESKEMKKELNRAKKNAKKEIKKEIKEEVKKLRDHNASDQYVLMMVLAVFIPPLAVGLTFGVIDKFWISLILTILFFIPGMVYSLIVIHNHFR